MKLKGCITSHFVSIIQEGMVKKVHNTDSYGRPNVKFKNLKDIYQAADANTKFDDISTGNEHRHSHFADRKTKPSNGYVVEEDEPDCPSDEDCTDKLTLSQLLKKPKRKKRKVSEIVYSTPNKDDDDSDLDEPLCKFRVKASKSSQYKKMPAYDNVKIEEASEVDFSESRETIHMADDFSVCNSPPTFIASESGIIFLNPESMGMDTVSFTNEEEKCGFNEASLDNLDNTDNTPEAGENMVLDDEENMANVNQTSLTDDSSVEELTTSTSDCSQSQQTPEQVNNISDVQDSDSTMDDMVSIDTKSLTVNPDADFNSLNSDKNSFVSEDTPNLSDSKVNMSNHNYQTDIKNNASDCIEPQLPERLPSTRKTISPNSQEKLRFAMKSAELSDDIDHYKCKEKLSFEEQTIITPKQMCRKPKNYKKGYPPEPRSSLDGPRLCRSLPRLSTGCTTVQGCSESAIAFSQRQMHDVESLASKLLSELNSMKVLVEEKMLFEAYRSPSLKNEADEVKSAIKSAKKTEESAKKWLSMMARDCNRFCKIMKLNEDNDASVSGEAAKIEEKTCVQREKKKISFADEAGGPLCDIKVYEIDETASLGSKQKAES